MDRIEFRAAKTPARPRRNIIENDRRIHMSDYRKEIADDGEMLVNTTDELIDLSMAYEPAGAVRVGEIQAWGMPPP